MAERAIRVLEAPGRRLGTGTVPAAGLLPADVIVAEPDVFGPLAVFPLLGASGEFEYCAFAEAVSHGFRLTELADSSVNDLRAANPLEIAVLLSDAEVLEGAQQDRIADVPVLLAPGTRRRIPVCCVEEGRWEEARREERFAASPAAMAPSLRALKSRRVREALTEGLDPRADQEEIWERIGTMLEDARIESRTAAMRDAYRHHHDDLLELESGLSRRDGQVGAVVFLHGRPVVFDYVSRPDVWAALWRPLARGYCLDALAAEDGGAWRVNAADAEDFLATADAIVPAAHDAIGMGRLLTLESHAAAGIGLMLERELIQASVFAMHRCA